MKQINLRDLYPDVYKEDRVKYNKPEKLFGVVNSAFHQAVPS